MGSSLFIPCSSSAIYSRYSFLFALFVKTSCLFCRIVIGEIPAELLYEDESAVAFLDIHPRAPGHTVVIPRHHAATIIELPEDKVPGLFQAVRTVARGIEKGLAAPGLTIGINHGKVSGQEIEHLHVHIFPRFSDDGGGAMQSVVNNPPQESEDALREKIKSHINA
ncbi:MAG: HIT domain-containing protein [Patescibacteria group bacterium]